MANKKFLLGILVLALVFGMTVVGCGGDDSLPPSSPPPGPGDTASNPIARVENIDLGNMTSPTSGWKQLLSSIESTKKYINLDLSACTMIGTEFNPDASVSDGKFYIVSLILPDSATSIAAGTSSSGGGTFYYFLSLKSINGAGINKIGDYAFSSRYLQAATFPEVTTIGKYAFYNCSYLTTLYIPKVSNIGECALRGITGSVAAASITITMGSVAPKLGEYMLYSSITSSKTVKVIVPSGATGYSPFTGTSVTVSGANTAVNWANGFRGAGWDGSDFVVSFPSNYINQNISLVIQQQ